jgi:hypothetical protein
MTQRDNILQELNELKSSLGNIGIQNVYTVPGGYFDNLISEVLSRIKALDTENASEELNYLSPLLNSISKKMPYAVPADFFNEQRERIMQIIKTDSDEQTVEEELETLSPLLSGLKKEMPVRSGHPGRPYSVPHGYFEELSSPVNAEEIKPAIKVISITRQRWFRYAAAAVVIGFVAIGSFLFFNKGENIDPKTQSSEWVKKNMKKVSTDEINNFVQLTDEEAPVIASVETKNEIKDKNDVQELIKDIPDNDIQKFLDETVASEPDNNDDDVLMN